MHLFCQLSCIIFPLWLLYSFFKFETFSKHVWILSCFNFSSLNKRLFSAISLALSIERFNFNTVSSSLRSFLFPTYSLPSLEERSISPDSSSCWVIESKRSNSSAFCHKYNVAQATSPAKKISCPIRRSARNLNYHQLCEDNFSVNFPLKISPSPNSKPTAMANNIFVLLLLLTKCDSEVVCWFWVIVGDVIVRLLLRWCIYDKKSMIFFYDFSIRAGVKKSSSRCRAKVRTFPGGCL